jgi:pimeloyl-ACP methyl ester carboxylesterase
MKRILCTLFVFLIGAVAFAQNVIKIEKHGKGRAIILLPGFTTPGSVWNNVIANLDQNHQTHTVSYPGFDGVKPIEMPWYDQILQQLTLYIEHEKLQDVVIIGHSMGGNLAVDLAFVFPKKVTGLILVESIPCMRALMMPGVNADDLMYDSPYNKQVLSMNDEAFRQMAHNMSQNMTTDQSKVAVLTEWTMKADRKTYVYGYTDLLKLDLRDKLKTIGVKALILGASFPDKTMVLSNYENQYSNLASKEILIADNSRHFIMFDQPEWLYKNVNKYLARK